jgi:hypothetical protein
VIQIRPLNDFAKSLIHAGVHIGVAGMQFALLSPDRCRYVAQIKTA